MREFAKVRELAEQHADEYQACSDAVELLDLYKLRGVTLEAQAVELAKKFRMYKAMMPATASKFLNDLAEHLGWDNLKEAMK